MPTPTKPDTVPSAAANRPPHADGCSDTLQRAVPSRRTADNGDAWSDPGLSRDELDVWAHLAVGSNGFVDVAAPMWPTNREIFRAAQSHRATLLPGIVGLAFRSIAAFARREYARYNGWRQERATYEALRRLDERMRRDLGFNRGESKACATDAARAIDPEELRAKLALLVF